MRRFLCTFSIAFCAGGAAVTQLLAAGQSVPAGVSDAVPVISWKDAGDFMGREVIVVGRVVKAGRAKAGHAFLNFDENPRGGGLTIFINKDHYSAFPQPPEQAYRNKTVKIRGYVYEFKKAANLALTRPQDITIVPDDTPLPPKPATASVASRPVVGDTITIGSYNVLNLFDNVDDPYTNDQVTPAKPAPELQALSQSIRALNADVLALCEVENRGVLQQFVNVHLSGMGYEVVLEEGNDVRGIDVAILSRIPVGPVTSHRHLRFPDSEGKTIQFQRDLLQARIEPATGQAFDVFVVHLKSKGGSDDGGLETRIGEARAMRGVFDRLLKQTPDTPFVLCGDFNDYIDSQPLKIVLGSGPLALTTFVSDLPPDQRITYNLPPYLSMIDFVLASPGMTTRYVPKSYRVVTGGSPDRTGSDHNPVLVRFRLH